MIIVIISFNSFASALQCRPRKLGGTKSHIHRITGIGGWINLNLHYNIVYIWVSYSINYKI